MAKKKSRSPSLEPKLVVDLDAALGDTDGGEVDEQEIGELRGLDPEYYRPISEIAMDMAITLHRGEVINVTVASMKVLQTTRRLLSIDLGRLAKAHDKVVVIKEKGTELSFRFAPNISTFSTEVGDNNHETKAGGKSGKKTGSVQHTVQKPRAKNRGGKGPAKTARARN